MDRSRNDAAAAPAILLTGAIRPAVEVAISDPAVRLQQYRRATESWLEVCAEQGRALGFVETSRYGAGWFDDIAGRFPSVRTTYVEFEPEPEDVVRGKGAIEFAAIEHALRKVQAFGREGGLFKVTGRHVITNSRAALAPMASTEVRVRRRLDYNWFDTRVIGASRRTWLDLLCPAGSACNDGEGRFIERMLAPVLLRGIVDGQVDVRPFPVRPRVVGASGTMGREYLGSLAPVRDITLAPIEHLLRFVAAKKQV